MNKQITPRPMHNTSRLLDYLYHEMIVCATEGIGYVVLDDEELKANEIVIGGKKVKSFGSCSYLGLELDPRMKAASIKAIEKYGTAFSSSRAYLSSPLYGELQELLEAIFQKPVIATPTTSLGHIAAIPSLVDPSDAIVLDHQVHASVQNAAKIAKANGTHVEMVRHSNLENLEWRIQKLTSEFRNVWYFADGVYSMFGDLAPFKEIESLLNKYDNLYLYVDDAHGMSWSGPRGSGTVLAAIEFHPKMVLATSMVKGFGGGGGILVFPDSQLRDFINYTGSTLFFSGPIQNGSLGACVCSAKIHLSPEINELQEKLKGLLRFTLDSCDAMEIPLAVKELTPIFFVPVSDTRTAYQITRKMIEKGFFLNIAAYPSVPVKNAGLRFTITNHMSEGSILEMLETLREVYYQTLAANGVTLDEVYAAFKLEKPGKSKITETQSVSNNM
ncbi:MAG: aminotransferase class I/II-fold pyridoxal phosphate-dependent enzyme [Gammaproteobacteria bacterium]|nr:MAG: aminotransferase class I/II-fold pyridoxal phosphate-dependent enzyme [Gammaproteobacteria bacterium]